MTEVFGTIGTMASAFVSILALIVAIRVNHQAGLPQIIAYIDIDHDKNAVSFIVSNVGRGVAYNVSLSGFDNEIISERFRDDVHKSFISKGIPILVPGASRKTIIAAGRIMDEMGERVSPITVTYFERGMLRKRKKVCEEFILDYVSLTGSIYTPSDEHEICNAIKKMSQNLEKIQKKIN